MRTKYETERYLNIEYADTQKQDSSTSSDAWLTLAPSDDRWSLAAWISNIEDEVLKNQAIIRPIINVTYVGLRAPRTYGLRAEYNF